MRTEKNKKLSRKDALGGAERIELYKILYTNPKEVIENPKLLDWFYILFNKPIIHTINGQRDNSVYYIWFIPPVVATVANGHFHYVFKAKEMYYEYKNIKYPCEKTILNNKQVLTLTRTDESMIGIQPRAR